jgi:NADH-quinone oxidoreductase subunit N
MNIADLFALLPLIIIAATAVIILLVLAFYRDHRLTAGLTVTGFVLALVSLSSVSSPVSRAITPLLIMDGYAVFFLGMIIAAGIVVTLLAYGYLEKREGHHNEFYVLLLLATLGSTVLVTAGHFASFFLGLETLSVSLYALIAYERESERGVEAGVKYLILAAASSAFLLFGMALIYAELGTMEFSLIASLAASAEIHHAALLAGTGMLVIGIGFKLALVPFHLWTPDVYEGAPAPLTAYVATVSKGAVFGLLLRYFTQVNIQADGTLFLIFAIIAMASMFAGNLLALLQNNIKRLLAYSSISHLGYLLVAFLASGGMRITAVAFYLAAYFVTTLGAFGVVSVMSGKERDADRMDDYRGLSARRPWLAGIFTAMLLSLAGIPLTAGFIGKFYVVSAGIGSALWLLVIILVVNSAIGLFYYLRIVVAMYQSPEEEKRAGKAPDAAPSLSLTDRVVLAVLMVLLVWLGVYPAPLIRMIQAMAARLV